MEDPDEVVGRVTAYVERGDRDAILDDEATRFGERPAWHHDRDRAVLLFGTLVRTAFEHRWLRTADAADLDGADRQELPTRLRLRGHATTVPNRARTSLTPRG
ncbi:hypothetical protein GCM10009557_96660 [Virgisporangium ochraceum]|uniref:Uncharacterized protein n=1 Tax=Virgisporangium ochraceum TaxID=65505 RepID=A0A8J4A1Y4_9ACTN|nr:hypothetical protein [Virgisporangium ochraceum]GIJ72638.1 hypothetical protein Voc01_075550 [Virgisporangium ochraceum]